MRCGQAQEANAGMVLLAAWALGAQQQQQLGPGIPDGLPKQPSRSAWTAMATTTRAGATASSSDSWGQMRASSGAGQRKLPIQPARAGGARACVPGSQAAKAGAGAYAQVPTRAPLPAS